MVDGSRPAARHTAGEWSAGTHGFGSLDGLFVEIPRKRWAPARRPLNGLLPDLDLSSSSVREHSPYLELTSHCRHDVSQSAHEYVIAGLHPRHCNLTDAKPFGKIFLAQTKGLAQVPESAGVRRAAARFEEFNYTRKCCALVCEEFVGSLSVGELRIRSDAEPAVESPLDEDVVTGKPNVEKPTACPGRGRVELELRGRETGTN